ncbi:MAG TPA: MFS transporter [Iamia sp.]
MAGDGGARGARLAEAVLPARLGVPFRWLWGQSLLDNLADGILLAAAPLLIASLTDDPFPVAMAVFLQRLPWLLFSVFAGAVVDRVDRRRLSMLVGVLRAAIVAALALVIATDALSIAAVYVAAFLLGTAETVADNAASTLVADTVPKAELGIANARLVGSLLVTNQMVGPPIGALLFGVGLIHPFTAYAVCMTAGVVLVSRVELPPGGHVGAERRPVRHEIVEGMRWLWAHAPVRTLALTITAFNITFGAAMAVYVLYARERLGVDDAGFGLLLSTTAVGGIVGASLYGRLERRFDLGTLMRVGLVVETATHLCLALLRSAWLVGLVMFVFGVHASVWGTTSTTVRQRAVPSHLLGRVGSVYLLGSVGAIAIGTVIGGVLADVFGLTAPFWFAFAGSAVVTVLMWPMFPLIAHSAEVGPDEETPLPLDGDNSDI